MDPFPFFRIRVGSLALKLPTLTSNLRQVRREIGFGSRSDKFVGRVSLVMDLYQVGLTGLLHNGWVLIADSKTSAELYVSLNLDPDPRFVFEFDGESECSPQVFQVQGNIKQPVFSCNFGFRNSGD